MYFLSEQAQTIISALKTVPILGTVAWLDDDQMMPASPAKMPAAWVVLENLDLDRTATPPTMGLVTWAVILKAKRLRVDALTGELPILGIADSIINCLHGLRGPKAWARPLGFVRMDCVDMESEAAAYMLRFTTNIYQMYKKTT